MSSTSTIRRGTSAIAPNAPATFRRRSCSPSPRCRGVGFNLRSSDFAGRSHIAPSSCARRSGGEWPRFSPRSRSPGTNVIASASSRGIAAMTSSAASRPRSRLPCSFHERTKAFARASYKIAPRAVAKPSRRPAHSAQRRTGHAAGEPHRSHTGGASRTNDEQHSPQSAEPGRVHTAQRRGRSTSSTQSSSPRNGHETVPIVCQLAREKTALASASDSCEPMSYHVPGTSHVYTGICGYIHWISRPGWSGLLPSARYVPIMGSVARG